MKIFLITALLSSTLAAVEPPKTHPASRYYSLWQNSAITNEPEKEVGPPPESDIDNWVLVGLEEYVTGKVITIVNKKNPRERLRIPGHNEEAKEFSILQVIKGQSSYLDTKVILQKGPHRGEVTFDSKYLVLRKAPAPKATSKKGTPTPTPRKTTAKSPLPTTAKPASTKSPSTRPAARQRFIPKPTK